MEIKINKMPTAPGTDDQIAVLLDGKRVALFSNSVVNPLNFTRSQRPEVAMLVAAAAVSWLTDNPVVNLPPPPPPNKIGRWKWIDETPELDLEPLPEESTAQATETPEATEDMTDG